MLVRLHGKQAREHHRLDFFKARQRLGGGILVVGDGVADLGVRNGFDIRVQKTDFSGGEFLGGRGFRRLVSQTFHFELLAVGPQANFLMQTQAAIQDAHQNDHAPIRIKPGIEDQGAQRSVEIPARRRHSLHYRLECFVNSGSLFGAHQ